MTHIRKKPLVLGVAVCAALIGLVSLLMATGQAKDEEPEFPPPISPYNPHIDPDDFVSEVDNPYFPLTPGTTYVYEGESDGEHEVDTVEVTHQTKKIMGVTTTVIHDTVTVDGEKHEETFDWYAQDKWGNVWYFGEDSKEFENGQVVSSHGSWEAGKDGAQPGIIMLAELEKNEKYRQEYAAGVAEDMAQILKLDEEVSVAYGDFEDVLVTKDFTPLDTKVVEQKFYAPGIGTVMEKSVRGPKETLELIDIQS